MLLGGRLEGKSGVVVGYCGEGQTQDAASVLAGAVCRVPSLRDHLMYFPTLPLCFQSPSSVLHLTRVLGGLRMRGS